MLCRDPQPQSEDTQQTRIWTITWWKKSRVKTHIEARIETDYSTVDLVVGEMDQSFGERNTHLCHGPDTIINCWCRVWGCKTLFVDAKDIKYRWGKLDYNIHSLQVLQSSANNGQSTDCARTCSDFRHFYSILWEFFLLSVQCFLWTTDSQCFISGRPSKFSWLLKGILPEDTPPNGRTPF